MPKLRRVRKAAAQGGKTPKPKAQPAQQVAKPLPKGKRQKVSEYDGAGDLVDGDALVNYLVSGQVS